MSEEATTTRALGIAIGAIGPVTVAGALVGLRDQMQSTNVALVLVLVVVLAAVVGGWQAGVVGALLAAVSYDFFHARPYLSLTIASKDDIETAFLLVAVGVSVGILAGRAHAARLAARAGSLAIARVHRVAELVAGGRPSADVLLAAQTELTALLRLQSCHFEGLPFGEPLPRIERSGALAGAGEYFLSGDQFELPRGSVELSVLTRGQPVGRFVLASTPGRGISLEQRIVAIAIADQVGAAFVPTSSSAENDRGV
ncbi:MAG: DUF4118 domain-containing protein [Actinomycetota bacterium]